VTAPGWNPTQNPGGQHRLLVRTAVHDWLVAGHIMGLDVVHLSMPAVTYFSSIERTGESDFSCQVGIRSPRRERDRLAYTGPEDPGGVRYTQTFELVVWHRSYDIENGDLVADEADYDRIIDAIIQQFSGGGRDLGRPDVVLSSGEYPRQSGIVDEHDPAVVDGSSVDRWGMITFQVQYVPPSPQEWQ
jgi:hypothetical protein